MSLVLPGSDTTPQIDATSCAGTRNVTTHATRNMVSTECSADAPDRLCPESKSVQSGDDWQSVLIKACKTQKGVHVTGGRAGSLCSPLTNSIKRIKRACCAG